MAAPMTFEQASQVMKDEMQVSAKQDGDGGSNIDDATSQLDSDSEDKAREQLIVMTVEIRMKETSTASAASVREAVERMISERGSLVYADGPLDMSVPEGADQRHPAALLAQHVHAAIISDTDARVYHIGSTVMMWQCQLQVHVYHAIDEGPAEDDEGEEGVPAYSEWLLPSAQFEGLWESLYYDSSVKQRLLRYAASALLFGERRVNASLISWNRVVLLHGPPGTGKTSLCKALAQKLSIRFSHRFRAASLVEVNAHSLFSKWFSESGKQVSKLFSKITELLEDPDVLVFVLIDEIESLAAARQASAGGSEPSDAVRAVNALLTQLDALKRFANVMVLTTSNITTAIDVAFVDRADIKAYIGPPTLPARYDMLRSSLQELGRAGVVQDDQAQLLWPFSKLQLVACNLVPAPAHPGAPTASVRSLHAGPASPGEAAKAMEAAVETLPLPCGARLLLSQPAEVEERPALALCGRLLLAALHCEGLSGRCLRKLPFLAHASQDGLPLACPLARYIAAVQSAAINEQEERRMAQDVVNGGAGH